MPLPFALEEAENKPIEKVLRHKKTRKMGEESLNVFNSKFRVGERLKNDIENYHDSRSQRAQTVDEQHNAPLPETVGEWANNPDRYDFPGVDTIPKQTREQRGKEFASRQKERGAVDDIFETDEALAGEVQNTSGGSAFDPWESEIRIEETLPDEPDSLDRDRGFVYAHEAGHAADAFATEGFGASKDYEFGEMFDDEEKEETVGQQLTKLSERARGSVQDDSGYRDSIDEKLADAAALSAIEPRAARREAPEAVEFLEDEGFLD